MGVSDPCSEFVSQNGIPYIFNTGNSGKEPQCRVCFQYESQHNVDRKCGNCFKLMTRRDQRLVIGDVVNNRIHFEKDEFCSHKCLLGFLQAWGY